MYRLPGYAELEPLAFDMERLVAEESRVLARPAEARGVAATWETTVAAALVMAAGG